MIHDDGPDPPPGYKPPTPPPNLPTLGDLDVEDDDTLDGLCDLDFDMGPDTTDELLPWVVLFGDLLDTEQRARNIRAVLHRADEWRTLFGAPT